MNPVLALLCSRIQLKQILPDHVLGLVGRCGNYPLIFSRCYQLKSPLEMPFWLIDSRRFLICLQIRMDELNETIQVFRRNLYALAYGWIQKGTKCLPLHFADQSSTHNDLGFRRRVLQRLLCPCRHQLRVARVASTPKHACHRGKAI